VLPLRTIVCPTDFSEPSHAGILAASELATHFGATVCLVNIVAAIPALPPDPNYVFKLPEYEKLLHADAEKNLKQLRDQLIATGISTRIVVGHGEAAEEIIVIAAHEQADLIVIATHGSTGWRHLVFGSVAEKVVRRAQCPVLTVRIPGEQH
jgi:nucleotide-binding universal stress UspA family protein